MQNKKLISKILDNNPIVLQWVLVETDWVYFHSIDFILFVWMIY